MRSIRNDTIAGLVIAVIAAIAYLLLKDLRIGTLARIGPGFFPILLTGMLALLSAVLLIKSFFGQNDPAEKWYPRPILFISLAVVVFGLLVERTGLIPATIAAVLVSGLSSTATRPRELLMLAPIVAVVVSVIFVFGLGLPIPILNY